MTSHPNQSEREKLCVAMNDILFGLEKRYGLPLNSLSADDDLIDFILQDRQALLDRVLETGPKDDTTAYKTQDMRDVRDLTNEINARWRGVVNNLKKENE
jgi:hypothetical protein